MAQLVLEGKIKNFAPGSDAALPVVAAKSNGRFSESRGLDTSAAFSPSARSRAEFSRSRWPAKRAVGRDLE